MSKNILIVLFMVILFFGCAIPKGDGLKRYELNITAVCNAPNCNITHTVTLEIDADIKKDQKADAKQQTEVDANLTGL